MMLRTDAPRRRPARVGLALASGFVAAIVAACSGGSDAGDSAAAPASAPAATAGPSMPADVCSLVTSDEAAKALGAPLQTTDKPAPANIPPRLATCRYVAPRGQSVVSFTVMLRADDTPAQARQSIESIRASLPDATPVPGLGDAAFTGAGQLHVLRGRLYLNITGDVDAATARSLAATALSRLQ